MKVRERDRQGNLDGPGKHEKQFTEHVFHRAVLHR